MAVITRPDVTRCQGEFSEAARPQRTAPTVQLEAQKEHLEILLLDIFLRALLELITGLPCRTLYGPRCCLQTTPFMSCLQRNLKSVGSSQSALTFRHCRLPASDMAVHERRDFGITQGLDQLTCWLRGLRAGQQPLPTSVPA